MLYFFRTNEFKYTLFVLRFFPIVDFKEENNKLLFKEIPF